MNQLQQANERMDEAAARLGAVVEAAVYGIVTTDRCGVIESFNPAAERMFGYRADEVIGRNVGMLMPRPHRDQHDQYMAAYLRTGRAKIIGIGREVLALRRDGTTFAIDLAISELKLGDRRLFTALMHDLTERKQLERAVLEIAAEQQQRIGRDLHDGLGQELTGISMLAGVLEKKLARSGSPEADAAAQIARLADDAIGHARALVAMLCPVDAQRDGLAMSVQQLAESMRSLYGVDCRFEHDDSAWIEDHASARHLYTIIQEAVSNAICHGRAHRVTIRLWRDGGQCVLSIEDDGVGIAEAHPAGGGHGLQIMPYYARMLGGTLEIRPGPDGGTIVTCRFH